MMSTDGGAASEPSKTWRNKSLTSLNVVSVPNQVEILYKELSAILLDPSSPTKLGYLRCDAFDLEEGEKIVIEAREASRIRKEKRAKKKYLVLKSDVDKDSGLCSDCTGSPDDTAGTRGQKCLSRNKFCKNFGVPV